jgi:putative membrane protein
MTNHRRYLVILSGVYLVVWLALAIKPYHRDDWALENILVVVAVVVLGSTYRTFPLSSISYTLIFLFLCLHAVGAHFTYSEVPYRDWMSSMGLPVDLDGRNHFDRFVHFSYGLLLAYPVREVFIRVATVRGFWGYFLPLDVTMSTSMLYELVEWGAAVVLGGELGALYLGTQGDVWDAHWDMALASLGALIAMAVTMIINSAIQRDFAQEWADSLRIRRPEPLGEFSIRRLLRESKER